MTTHRFIHWIATVGLLLLAPVQVNAAPTCSPSGPATIAPGGSALYLGQTNLPSPIFTWSATGDVTALTPQAGGMVSVTAGASGSIDLTLDIASSAGSTSCTRTIAITAPPPECEIQGASALTEGTSGHLYWVLSSPTPIAVDWSLTGPGVVVPAPGPISAYVTATDPGILELTAVGHLADGGTRTCTKSITVNPFTCSINGPATVSAGSTGLIYAVSTELADATYAWTVSGNAMLTGGLGGPAAVVTAGATGTFEVHLSLSRHGVTRECSRTITITPGTPCTGTQPNAKLMLHVVGTTTKAVCTRSVARPNCLDVSYTFLPLYPALRFAYLLVNDGAVSSGIGGLECGISYAAVPGQGVDIYEWTLCGDSEAPSGGWPASGGGNRILWTVPDHCQRTVPAGEDPNYGAVAIAGYFYLAAYTPDLMRITPHPLTGTASVLDCSGCATVIAPAPGSTRSPLGIAAFGQGGGYNPCRSLVPVAATSWSAIKAQFGVPPAGRGVTPRRR